MTSHYSTFSVAMGNHLIPSSGSPDPPQYHAGRTDVTAEVGDPWIQNVTLGSWILPTCSWPPTRPGTFSYFISSMSFLKKFSFRMADGIFS